ncbi:pyridoxamine 5'-phosphate oxidase family protein [Kitasatospora sp. NPDC004745]|uniref:pyridoxamine 5'-phosphate oxidase family protein n=1 Tax=Kitasatospora sp. NPDC004745 TaxID=3364019 RepID=UPI0036BAFCCE
MAHDPRDLDDAFLAFWRERHIATLTTVRPDATPHVVPVGVTYQPETATARVITSRTSRKARNVAEAGPAGLRVALCQVDRARWSTLEGVAVVRDEPEQVAEAERRYAERYREPRVNPDRVVIEIAVDRVLGRA